MVQSIWGKHTSKSSYVTGIIFDVMPLSELFYLLAGALVGAYLQSGREKLKRIRSDVCDKMAGEIRTAKLTGDIDQENAWTEWTEIDDLVRRELPEGLREQFSYYFQMAVDLDEKKSRLGYKNKELGSTFASETDLLEWEEEDLRVATSEYEPPVGDEKSIHYGADFEDWMLEYSTPISDLFEEKDLPLPIPGEVEETIRSHEPDNHEFQTAPETWDSIDEDWGEIFHDVFIAAQQERYSLHVELLEGNKRAIQESAEKIDDWFAIIVNTNIYVPYWLTFKKNVREVRQSGIKEVLSGNKEEYRSYLDT